MPAASTDVSDAWARFEHALAGHAPAVLADLGPPVAPLDAYDFAALTGLPQPDTLRALYQRHDGQRGGAPGLFLGIRFLPASEAATEWGRWTSLIRDDPSLVDTIGVTARPEGAVQAVYAHAGWLPIASDGAGNHLAVDLAPGPTGTPGQVISFGADEPVRRVLAPSALHLLAWCAQALETGGATAAAEGFRIGKATNLLDALPALMG